MAVAQDAHDRLSAARDRLAQWGVRVPDGSRVHQALGILEHGAVSGVLAPIHRGDDLGLRTLELAFDFAAIGRALPNEKIKALRQAIERSLDGPLMPIEADLSPAQSQSEVMLRTMLIEAGQKPVHPRTKTKSPDLLLENGLSIYGLEAK